MSTSKSSSWLPPPVGSSSSLASLSVFQVHHHDDQRTAEADGQEISAIMMDMADSDLTAIDLAEEQVEVGPAEKREKRMKIQDAASQLKDLRVKTTAELSSVASLHRALKCLPYAKDCGVTIAASAWQA